MAGKQYNITLIFKSGDASLSKSVTKFITKAQAHYTFFSSSHAPMFRLSGIVGAYYSKMLHMTL